MNKLVTTLLAATSLLGLSAQPLFAGDWNKDDSHPKQGWNSDHHGKGAGIEEMKKHLDLSDDQANQLKALFESKQKQVKPLKEQQRSDQKAVMEMIRSAKLDEAKLDSLAKSIGDNKTKIVIIRTKNQIEMMKILNDEQRRKYHEYWSGKSNRHHGGEMNQNHNSMN